jgi:hypothetical protein
MQPLRILISGSPQTNSLTSMQTFAEAVQETGDWITVAASGNPVTFSKAS